MSEQTPPLNEATPALSTEAPPSNPESPPAPEGLPSGEGLCAGLCSAVQSAGCEVPDCIASCSGDPDLEALSACADEMVALFSCMVVLPEFSCGGDWLNDQPSEAILEACATEALTFARCAGLDLPSGEEDSSSGTPCTLQGDQCDGCETECEACVCVNPDSIATCASLCAAETA